MDKKIIIVSDLDVRKEINKLNNNDKFNAFLASHWHQLHPIFVPNNVKMKKDREFYIKKENDKMSECKCNKTDAPNYEELYKQAEREIIRLNIEIQTIIKKDKDVSALCQVNYLQGQVDAYELCIKAFTGIE